MTYDLIETPAGEILKGELQMRQKALEAAKAAPEWGPHPDRLPAMSWADFTRAVAGGRKLVVLREDAVEGAGGAAPDRWFVLDVARMLNEADYMMSHPGGTALLAGHVGTDITDKFNRHKSAEDPAGYYKHSNAAHNSAVMLRVARLTDRPPVAARA
jgi:hypothetical protein